MGYLYVLFGRFVWLLLACLSVSVSSALGRRRVREAAFGAIAVMFCDMAMPIRERTLMSHFPQTLDLVSLILGADLFEMSSRLTQLNCH